LQDEERHASKYREESAMNSSMDGAIKKALSNLSAEAMGECPDENTMSAYIEGLLAGAPLLQFESHLASCSNCRQILALCLRLEEAGEAKTAPAVPEIGRRRVLFHISIPISVIAMLLVAVGAGILFYRLQSESKVNAPVVDTASLRVADKPQDSRVPAQAPEKELKKSQAPRMEAAKPAAVSTKVASDETDAKISLPAVSPPAVQQPADLRASFQSKPAAEIRAAVEPDQPQAVAEAPSPAKAEQMAVTADLHKDQEGPEIKAKSVSAEQMTRAPASRMRTPAGSPVGGAVGGVLGPTSRDFDPHSVLLSYAQAARREGARFSSAKVDERTFLEYGAYWIDSSTVDHLDAQILAINTDSAEAREIAGRVTGINKLFSSGKAVFVFWKEKIYLIR
jgi:hypothetical protein